MNVRDVFRTVNAGLVAVVVVLLVGLGVSAVWMGFSLPHYLFTLMGLTMLLAAFYLVSLILMRKVEK